MWLCAAGVLRVAKEMAERRRKPRGETERKAAPLRAVAASQGGILLRLSSGSGGEKEEKKKELPSQPDTGQMLGMPGQASPSRDS